MDETFTEIKFWSYVFLKTKIEGYRGSRYGIHEGFFGEDGELLNWTTEPVGPFVYEMDIEIEGKSAKELLEETLSSMRKCIERGLIDKSNDGLSSNG